MGNHTGRNQRTSTETYGQGQSGYTAGRIADDPSLDMENRNQGYGARFQERHDGTDERFTSRGGTPYYQDRGNEDRGYEPQRGYAGGGFGDRDDRGFSDRGDDRGFGGAEHRGYNSGYNQGAGGYGGMNIDRVYGGGFGGDRRFERDDRGFNGDRYRDDQRFSSRRPSGNWDMDRPQHEQRTGFSRGSSFNSQGGGQGGYGAHLGGGRSGGYGQHGSTQSGFGQDFRGPHRGKGPQGWQRSDERIKDMVCEVLADDEHIDATHIDVTVTSGEVILSGNVPDRRTKRLAEDIVEGIAGVKDVQNQLKIGKETFASPSSSQANGGSKHRA